MPRHRPHAARRRGGRWSRAHARRLLWRAGFGATPAELDHHGPAGGRRRSTGSCAAGAAAGRRALVGPAPRVDGRPLDPVNEWGHDVLWWLDRMVRSQRPLVEKLTLFWHDHFATSDQDTPTDAGPEPDAAPPRARLLPRRCWAPSRATRRCSCSSRWPTPTRTRPNENYARELMELFTLGAGNGYSERDMREAARALTGFRGHWADGGPSACSYDREPARRRRQAHLRPPRALRLATTCSTSSCGHPRHAAVPRAASCGTSSSPSRSTAPPGGG